MQKVLFVTPYYAPYIIGGAEISTQLIAEGFPDWIEVLTMSDSEKTHLLNGVVVNCVRAPRAERIWRKALENRELTFSEKLYANLNALLPNKKLVQNYISLFRQRHIDLVVMNSNIEVLGRVSVWAACRESGVKSVLVLRDPLLLEKQLLGIRLDGIYRHIVKGQMGFLSSIAAPSRYMIDLYSQYGMVGKEVVVIPNAVDTMFRAPGKKQMPFAVIFAGGIYEKKGVRTLLTAVSMLYQQDERVSLHLYGRGDLEDECRDYTFAEVSPWLERDQLYEKMRQAKVVVLPSQWPEAFGRVLIEAVAQGTLAVGSDAGGIPEIFDGDERYIFPAGDPSALAAKLDRIFSLSDAQYDDEVRALQQRFQKYSYDAFLENWRAYLQLPKRS